MLELVTIRTENIVGKEEIAGYQHFSPFVFSKGFFLRFVKNISRGWED